MPKPSFPLILIKRLLVYVWILYRRIIRFNSWNLVISGCVRLGDVELALKVLGPVFSLVRPNLATFNTLLSVIPDIACLDYMDLLLGMWR